MSAPFAGIELGDSTAHGGGASAANNTPFSIEQDLAQLIAQGSDAYAASGTRVIKLDAGILAAASPYQIGTERDGVTCTADMVAANQKLINAFAEYAKQNGYSITVEARLALNPWENWNYLWLGPAVTAGLPIMAVENDDEIAWCYAGVAGGYAQEAANEVLSLQQITKYYPSVQVGQWEAQGPVCNTQAWVAAYNQAANAASVPSISYLVADVCANASSISPPSAWQTWITQLSQFAIGKGLGLTVFVGGSDTDGSGQQWTAATEQQAANLARLTGVSVDTLLIRTWGYEFPSSILPVNEPSTLGNAAAEIAAVFPLYQSGKISANGTLTASVNPQIVVATGLSTSVGPIALKLTDVAGDARIAVVVLDETGLLSAQASGSGTVNGAGTNRLILNGTCAEVVAELATLRSTEPVAGPDSIDIEVFGSNGRLGDNQVAVLSVPHSPPSSGSQFNFLPASPLQQWTAASANVNGSGVVTSMHFDWNPTTIDPNTGAYCIIRSVSIHEPFAQDGLVVAGSRVEQSAMNLPASNPACLALNSGFAFNVYYSPAHFSTVNVLSTDMYYSSTYGSLMSIVQKLAPTDPTARVPGAALANYFALGGTEVTLFNTGSNPGWQGNWNADLSSVTMILGSQGQLLESFYQGGVKDPDLTLDNVFDPYTGKLWEQFETLSSAAPYQNYIGGDQLITEFNTGDNPNWNYTAWGSNQHVTITWQDYYPIGVSASAPAPGGPDATDAYGPEGVTSVTTTPVTGTLCQGQVVTFTLSLSAAVTITGGAPSLLLNDGGTATYFGGSGTNTLTFTYTVAAGQYTSDLAVSSVAPNGAIILDRWDNAVSLAGAIVNPAGRLVVDPVASTDPHLFPLAATTHRGASESALNGGCGDFNSDGKSDILWQNDDGTASLSLQSGSAQIVWANPGPAWHVKDSGDFNGDGRSDILWQNDDGTVAIWELNGTSVIGGGVVWANPGPAWHVKGSGDFNGDGKSDILWQNDDGTGAIWALDGTAVVGGGAVGAVPGPNSHIIGSDTMHFINAEATSGTLSATSESDEFVFTSYVAGAHAINGFDPMHDLIEFSHASLADFAALKEQSTVSGGSTLITLDNSSSLLLHGVLPDSLQNSNFVFV
jgi:hypothetical protein